MRRHNYPPLRPRRQCLTFAPRAWLKLMWFCHAGDTEVGGFGLTAPNRPLYVTDFLTLPQEVTSVSVRFPDEAVADFFDRCVDQGIAPEHFARIWLHTHPGTSARPSGTDEITFRDAFGKCDWSIMAIVSRAGHSYGRLRFAAGPGASVRLGIAVDWAAWPVDLATRPAGLDRLVEGWQKEFQAHIRPPTAEPLTASLADAFGIPLNPWDWSETVDLVPIGGPDPHQPEEAWSQR